MLTDFVPSIGLPAWGIVLVVVGYAWRALSHRAYQRAGLGGTVVYEESHSAFADIVLVAGIALFVYGVVA